MHVKGREPEFDEKVNVKGEMKEHLNTKMVWNVNLLVTGIYAFSCRYNSGFSFA